MIIEIKVYNLIHIHMSSGSEMTLMLKHWTVIGDVDSTASKQQEMKNHIEISHSLSVYSKPVSRSVFKCLYRICWYYFYSVRNPPQPTLCAVTITQSGTWLFSSLRSTKPDSPSKSSQFQCNSVSPHATLPGKMIFVSMARWCNLWLIWLSSAELCARSPLIWKHFTRVLCFYCIICATRAMPNNRNLFFSKSLIRSHSHRPLL